MSTLQTFQFWLEPDREIPRFKRLHWHLVDVPVADVLLQGIHPWQGHDKHPSLLDALLQRLNSEEAKVAALTPMGHSYDVISDGGYVYGDRCRFQRTLKTVHEDMYFVEDLSYMELLDIAKQRLRNRWDHSIAKALAERAHCGFQSLRQFLKSKDKSIKLSSYDDVDTYNLGNVLTLDDFERHDKLLINEAIPTQNFRSASALAQFTDGQGRLRLTPEIRAMSLAVIVKSEMPHISGTHVQWHITRSGHTLTFRPDLGGSASKRPAAEEFAKRWRTDDGKLVFRTTVERLGDILEREGGTVSFPALNYTSRHYEPTAAVEVEPSRVRTFHIGRFATSKCTGEMLRELLRENGVSMTGNKDNLLAKLGKLAADKYTETKPTLDDYFQQNRYMRITASPSATAELPVLEELRYLRNLVLAMYALRHLRGGVLLEPSHENPTYTPEELALALLDGKVAFTGALLRVT
ncbi:MAG: hypothetical protein AMXMBFR84_47550 [Candidatus Hydrogenedentota bacterium]